jgi:hypothetical protein
MDNNNMKKQYNNFVEVERMLQFLDIQEVTTKRQKKNGTREFKLPIKDLYCYKGSYIHVASFASGYVRRTKAGGYCASWQLNKRCESEPQYYESDKKDWTGKPLYRQFTTRGCVLIPNEQDRIAYLISFCLKNYYINRANIVARSSDKYIPKWKYEDDLKEANTYYGNNTGAMDKIEELQNPEVKVIVNGHRYNVSEWFK